ncbi:protein kintoun [Anabrus simplex]|uniref:protein kintoun n=1 Tax=Anabrus simplex TaxID=316456 RepID=UPI0035A3B5B2
MEDIDITREEAQRLGEALKTEEFQKLLKEYYDEVNDPENKKKYQEEVTQFEKERGYDITFINPEPGYVIKTSVDGEKKAFINICICDKIGKPASTAGNRSGTDGRNWSIPYSLVKPREDLDKNGKRCFVYDVVFHPETHRLAASNPQFKNAVNLTALDAIENNLGVKLDRKNLKFPKLGYKGAPLPSMIRKKSEKPPPKTDDGFDINAFAPPINNTWYKQNTNENYSVSKESRSEKDSIYTVPKYLIKHRSPIDIQNYTNDRFAPATASLPKELVIEIHLPLLNSTESVVLDVMEKSVSLLCEKPAKYKLDLVLPYTVNEDAGNARFDKSTRKLILTLPLKYRQDLTRECDDSGVESDLGSRTPETSSGDDDSIEAAINGRIPKIEEIKSETDSGEIKVETSQSTSFLNPNRHYSLPPYICDINNNVIKLTFQIKNVDPTSVGHIFFGNSSCGIHIRFSSMGSGYFPLHYAFCVRFPSDFKISESKKVDIETLDNYVSVQFELEPCDTLLTEYFVGVTEESLERREVSEDTEELKSARSNNADDCFVSASHGGEAGPKNAEVTSSVNISSQIKQRALARTLSESSGDDFSSSPRKGILKRTSRSMSESSVDDFFCSSSFEMISEEDDGNNHKKSVRFNDVVSQKVYRTNSSILGQRKKNQRKIRNKKKAQENRRASESETSDWEEKEDKEKGDKTGASDENGNETDAQNGKDSLEMLKTESGTKTTGKQNESKYEKVEVEVVTDMMFDLDM